MSNYLDQIRIRAMRAITVPTYESWLRHIFRWYSKEFHTPLHKVDHLPLEWILQHFFESQFEQMDSDDRHKLAQELLLSPEEREMIKLQEEDSFDQFVKESQKKSELQRAKKDPNYKLTQTAKSVKELLAKLEKEQIKPTQPVQNLQPVETTEEILIEHVDDEDLMKELNSDFAPTK